MSSPQEPILIASGTQANYNPVSASNPLPVGVGSVTPPASLVLQRAAVGVSASQLSNGAVTQGIYIKALHTNTGKVYIGTSSGVTTSTGYPLAAGESVFIACSNANAIYLIADAASQGAAVLGG